VAISYNTSIVRDGLILNIDANNPRSNKGRNRNVLSWYDWPTDLSDDISATGSWPSYGRNGEVGINTRTLDTNPFGVSDIVWNVSNQDAASDDDGGWNTSTFAIDVTKTYRFSTWMRRKTVGNGSSYLGPHSNWSAVPGEYILNRSNAAENQNPYFVAAAWWGVANDWYLVVGHVWAAGSGTGSAHPDSGIYNTAGTKIASCTDFMWAPTNTTSFQRSYLYYSTDVTTNQQWYQPRVDALDGTQPTITELLNNAGNRCYNLVEPTNTVTLFNQTRYAQGAFVFDGSHDYIGVSSPSGKWNWAPTSSSFKNTLSIEMWVKSSDTSGQYISKPWNGNGEYNYQSSHNSWFTSVGNQSHSQSFTSLATGNWEHVVFIVTPTQKAVYRNGIINAAYTNHSITNNTPTTANNNEDLALMTLYPYGFYTWDQPTHAIAGSLASCKIYNKVLSAAEVLQNFTAMRGRFGV
jgi:hypothetical protein